jgi:hypothetical protein
MNPPSLKKKILHRAQGIGIKIVMIIKQFCLFSVFFLYGKYSEIENYTTTLTGFKNVISRLTKII